MMEQSTMDHKVILTHKEHTLYKTSKNMSIIISVICMIVIIYYHTLILSIHTMYIYICIHYMSYIKDIYDMRHQRYVKDL